MQVPYFNQPFSNYKKIRAGEISHPGPDFNNLANLADSFKAL